MTTKTVKEIRNLITVILLGVVAAFGIVIYALNAYGPTGQYILKNTLLSPLILSKLNYSDYNPKKGANDNYVFGGIDFEYFVPKENRWMQVDVSRDSYQEIYKLIENDISFLETDARANGRYESQPARLILKMKAASQNSAQQDTKIFQEVQFRMDGNDYRVELHEDKLGRHWAYFENPGIYQKVIQILTHSP